jgi:hypothetical protein
MNAAGRSVFFAGCTVILALLGLVAFGLGSLQGMALSVALTVLVTMLAALTPAARAARHLRPSLRPPVHPARRAATGQGPGRSGHCLTPARGRGAAAPVGCPPDSGVAPRRVGGIAGDRVDLGSSAASQGDGPCRVQEERACPRISSAV